MGIELASFSLIGLPCVDLVLRSLFGAVPRQHQMLVWESESLGATRKSLTGAIRRHNSFVGLSQRLSQLNNRAKEDGWI